MKKQSLKDNSLKSIICLNCLTPLVYCGKTSTQPHTYLIIRAFLTLTQFVFETGLV